MEMNDNELDKLIAEMLNEKNLKGYDIDFQAKTSGIGKNRGSKSKPIEWLVGSSAEPYQEIAKIFNSYLNTGNLGDSIKRIAQQAKSATDILNQADFQAMVTDKNNPFNRRILDWANSMARHTTKTTRDAVNYNNKGWSTSRPDWEKTHKEILDAMGGLLKMSPAPSDDKDLGGDSPTPEFPIKSDYGTVTGRSRTPMSFVKLFNNVLKGTTDMSKRFARLEEITGKIANKKAVDGKFFEAVSGIYAVDMLRTIVQDYEASTSGFLFENFLALLANGTVEGGSQKIDDFYIGADFNGLLQMAYDDTNGTPASAKLLKAGSREFAGSQKLVDAFFQAFPNGAIKYIVGIKGQNLEKIDIFVVDVTSASQSRMASKKYYYAIPLTNPVATVNLEPFTNPATYEENVKVALDAALNNIGTVNQLINTTRASLLKMSTATDVGDRTKAALSAMVSYNKLTNIVDPVEQAAEQGQPQTQAGQELKKQTDLTKRRAMVNENNEINLDNLLDKLVQEVILTK